MYVCTRVNAHLRAAEVGGSICYSGARGCNLGWCSATLGVHPKCHASRLAHRCARGAMISFLKYGQGVGLRPLQPGAARRPPPPKNATQQSRNCCPKVVAPSFISKLQSHGQAWDTCVIHLAHASVSWPACEKYQPALPRGRKHCEFICGGTELQCFFDFLPVWDRQGGNIGKHSNLG